MAMEEEFDPTADEGDFVPAIFARTVEAAEEYRELLNEHDIPAMVGEEETGRRRGMTRGLPVLVPEVLLDEASEIIAEFEEQELEEEEEEFEEADDLDEEEDEDEEFEFEQGFDDELDEEEDPDEDDDDEEFFDDDDEL